MEIFAGLTSNFLVTTVRAVGSRFEADKTSLSCASCKTPQEITVLIKSSCLNPFFQSTLWSNVSGYFCRFTPNSVCLSVHLSFIHSVCLFLLFFAQFFFVCLPLSVALSLLSVRLMGKKAIQKRNNDCVRHTKWTRSLNAHRQRKCVSNRNAFYVHMSLSCTVHVCCHFDGEQLVFFCLSTSNSYLLFQSVCQSSQFLLQKQILEISLLLDFVDRFHKLAVQLISFTLGLEMEKIRLLH